MPQYTPLKLAIIASELTGREIGERIGKDHHSVYRWANDRRKVPYEIKMEFARVLSQTPAAERVDTSLEALFPPKPKVAESDQAAA